LNACYLPDGPKGERAKFLSMVIELALKLDAGELVIEADDKHRDHLRSGAS